MSVLTAILIIMVTWAVYHFLQLLLKKDFSIKKTRARLKHIKTIGTFGLVTGILGQLIGFYQAFAAIEQAGDISPSLMMGGFKVSMITTLYGIFIFLVSLLLWLVFDFIVTKKLE